MRTILVTLTVMLLLRAAAAGPAETACATEEFLAGTDEACGELRDPFRAGNAIGCHVIWFFAEHEPGAVSPCGPFADVETEWGTWYVDWAPYEETNGCDGLQRVPTDCDGDGEPEPADRTPARGWTLEDLLP